MKVYLVTLFDVYKGKILTISKVFSSSEVAKKWVDEIFLSTLNDYEILHHWESIGDIEILSILENFLPNETCHTNIYVRPVLLDDITKPDNIL